MHKNWHHTHGIRLVCALVGLAVTTSAPGLDRIVIGKEGNRFVSLKTGKAFRPWGVNYGNAGRLLEDFWATEWQTVADDFSEIRQLGANVVRIHLQYGKMMDAVDRPNAAAFAKLRALLEQAESTGLYLDITGLACYRTSDVPAWYDDLDDASRWRAQATFWREIARACKDSPAVFCYDLMNEPLSPGQSTGKWYSGKLFGGYDFLQNVARNPGNSERSNIATAWIDHLSATIREQDRQTLITVGMLPWVRGWRHLSGFIPVEVAPHVDFLSVHIYPKTKDPEEAAIALRECDVGKPVLIEELFPLECTVQELEEFVHSSRRIASGWIWHYDGRPLEEYDRIEAAGKLSVADGIWRTALKSFVRLGDQFRLTP